jgi:hypothetical protein
MTGPMRKLLFTYPQASLEIAFTAYLDPVVEADGSVRNSFKEIEPAISVIKRASETLTRRFFIQRLDALSKGQMKQRIRSSQLFAGLLMEQYAMERSEVPYKYVPIEKRILLDAVRRSLADEDWTVRIQIMSLLLLFPTPLDFEITKAVSENLEHDQWPVRMLGLYLLSKQGSDFKPVLDWAAKYDSQRYVRDMAVALGADEPPEETEETEESENKRPRRLRR